MFTNDPKKDADNLGKHGVSLAFGERVVDDPNVIDMIDDRADYGEERWMALGLVDGAVWSAVYTERGDGIRFISVRRATQRETNLYFTRNSR